MMSTYTDRFGKLTMTHYCSFGTKPIFNLSSMTENTLDFDFDATCGLKEGEHTFVKDITLKYDPKKDVLINNDAPDRKGTCLIFCDLNRIEFRPLPWT